MSSAPVRSVQKRVGAFAVLALSIGWSVPCPAAAFEGHRPT